MQTQINSLLVPDTIKAYLNGNETLQRKHQFYIQLTEFYTPAFHLSSKERLKSLSFSAYLYFRALLLVDSFVDKKNDNNKLMDLMLFLSIFEEAIKQLSWIFPEESPFWKKFYQAKRDYFETIFFERKFNIQETSIINKEDFLKIATGKSAICYAILDALNYISNAPICLDDLVNSLKHIHIGFQYLDDIDDFKKDMAEGQRTFPASLVDEELKKKNYSSHNLDGISKYKYLFVSGIAGELIAEAKDHFGLAASIAEKYQLGSLSAFLLAEIKKCERQIEEIKLLIGKAKIKQSKSNIIIPSNRSFDEIMKQGVLYLENSLDSDSCWKDFMTSAGHGTQWVTAYAGLQVHKIKEAKNLLSNIKFVMKNSSGSFNSTMIEDADSLNFVVGFQRAVFGHCDSEIQKRWLSFMAEQGGWSTYNDGQLLRSRLSLDESIDLSGWTSPVLCVTAAAAYILSFFPELSAEKERTISYLMVKMNANNSWNSYWWTSSIYATSFAILALANNEKYKEQCLKSCAWIVKHQNQNGAWTHVDNQESEFYTALAITALMEADFDAYNSVVEKSINWLVANQTEDGSWKSARILQIPATSVKDPREIKNWRKSSFGVNILVDDHNRIFTSSTVLNALDLYRKLSAK